MKSRERKAKIGYYSLSVVFCLLAIVAVALFVVAIVIGVVAAVIAGLLASIVAIFFAAVYIECSKQIHNKYVEMYKLSPLVRDNYERVQEELEKIGFSANEKYSSLGYEYLEMRDDFFAPDNFNIEMDRERKEIVVYSLSPFSFKRYSFNDIVSCSTENVYTKLTGEYITNICVVITFSDGYKFSLPASDKALFVHKNYTSVNESYIKPYEEAVTVCAKINIEKGRKN